MTGSRLRAARTIVATCLIVAGVDRDDPPNFITLIAWNTSAYRFRPARYHFMIDCGTNLMTRTFTTKRLALASIAVMAAAGAARAQTDSLRLAGFACAPPPVLHCPDAACPSDRVINQGPVVDMKTRRTYFLDYPCDLKRGEKVTLILSLHGGGSFGNWQRHYF